MRGWKRIRLTSEFVRRHGSVDVRRFLRVMFNPKTGEVRTVRLSWIERLLCGEFFYVD